MFKTTLIASTFALLGGTSCARLGDPEILLQDGGGASVEDLWSSLGGAGNLQECEPGAVDEPDRNGQDTNCDGLDGDVARSIFVAPGGQHGAPGTSRRPLKSLAVAIALAQQRGFAVLACQGKYAENLILERKGVRLFGGYDCEHSWGAGTKPSVLAPRQGVPLVVRQSSAKAGKTEIHDFVFEAGSATVASGSSIAATVVDASDVHFRHVTFLAGAGAAAGSADLARTHSEPADPGPPGDDAPPEAAYTRPQCGFDPSLDHIAELSENAVCARIQSTVPRAWRCPEGVDCSTPCETDAGRIIHVTHRYGGHGGNGFLDIEAGLATTSPGQWHGLDGSTGGAATAGFGTIDSDAAYVPSNVGTIGRFGEVGSVGLGGDGGMAEFYAGTGDAAPLVPRLGGGGGAGGKAGCGGFPGAAGLAGGASIGLIVINSGVTLERVSVVTSTGGRGGTPSAGSPGQEGGHGGRGGESSLRWPAASGQPGGRGGAGGAGGPGGGGPSVGIVVRGTMPIFKVVRFEPGTGGAGGRAIEGSAAGRGADGVVGDVLVSEGGGQ